MIALGACTSPRFLEDAANYAERVNALQQRIVADSADAGAFRKLGVIHLRTSTFREARSYLERAYALDSAHPETRFYLGLALEATGAPEAALQLYGSYPEVSPLSRYRRLLAGRYTWLFRRTVVEEMQARLRQEENLGRMETRPGTVAVFPLVYQGKQARYAPLGKGLSAMLMQDLEKVQRLRALERLRLQVLLDELALGQTVAIDPATAPRLGRLLGAERVVVGSYDVLEGEVLRLDVASWSTEGGVEQVLASQSEALSNLFALEKDVVFALVEALGIELTPGEREQIDQVPTRNLQAFLAYSQGLEAEDRGQFEAARGFFRQAQELDPAFGQASERLGAVESVSVAGGEVSDLAAATGDETAPSVDAGGLPSTSQDLLHARHQTQSGTLGGMYVPGEEARDPVPEVTASTTLPYPSQPPPRGN